MPHNCYSVMSLKELVILSIIIVVKCNQDNNEYMRREHSLIRPYHGSSSSLNGWDMLGMAFASDTSVRLTPDIKSALGGVWNKQPCFSQNWELHVHFRIHGHGTVLFGDGMAIWYTQDRSMCPGHHQCSVFGGRDYFTGLALFLDTYNNHNGEHNHGHPYISAMVNNGSLHYDHDTDGTHTEVAGCAARFRGRAKHETHIKLRYLHDKLTVFTDVGGKKQWRECFSVAGVVLPLGYYFGVTAATGDLSDNHDVISVRFYDLDSPGEDFDMSADRAKVAPSASFFAAPRDHVDDRTLPAMGGFKKFLLVLVGLAVIGGALYIGFNIYQKQRDEARRRYY